MSHSDAPTAEPPAEPDDQSRWTLRLKLHVDGAPGVTSATVSGRELADGSQELWVDQAGAFTPLMIAPGETFTAAIRRLFTTIGTSAQASYPICDPTSESTVAAVPNPQHGQ